LEATWLNFDGLSDGEDWELAKLTARPAKLQKTETCRISDIHRGDDMPLPQELN
jgi:hypothetical protein